VKIFRIIGLNKQKVVMTGATSGAGTAYPSVASEFTPGF